VRTINFLTQRSLRLCLAAAILALAATLTGCGNNKEPGEAQFAPPQALVPAQPGQSTAESPANPTIQPIIQPTPTIFTFGPLVFKSLDLRADPVSVPLELEIPALNVKAPVLGVGLTADNVMDSPKGPIGDPIWHTAYWYRGGGTPGDVGTATIAGHVNDPLGNPEIFANLQDLKPGDKIIIHLKETTLEIRFIVNEVQVYFVKESSDPEVLAKIYGIGPVTGREPQPSPDGLSHLTLITCAGNIVNGQFDHHTVVYATRIK
jgi:sortase (surface protein transpeptidase)